MTLLLSYNAGSAQGTETRASSATYFDVNGVVQTVGNNVRRDTHFINGRRTNLLEKTSTNLALWSEALDNAAWVTASATIVPDSTQSPAGTLTADTLTATLANGNASQSFVKAASSLSYTYTHFVKANAGTSVELWLASSTAFTNGANARFDLSAGTISIAASTVGVGWSNARASITPLANGWYRCAISATSDALPALTIGIIEPNTGSIFAWGAQLELLQTSTSYIATTTVSVARSSDVFTLPALFAEQALTMYVKYIDLGSQVNARGICALGLFAVNPALIIFGSSSTNTAAQFHNGTTGQSTGNIATGVVIGDTCEARVTLTAGGVAQLGFSRNSAAEVLSTATAGQAFGAGWGNSILLLNDYNSSQSGYAAFSTIRVATGIQSLATMRNGGTALSSPYWP